MYTTKPSFQSLQVTSGQLYVTSKYKKLCIILRLFTNSLWNKNQMTSELKCYFLSLISQNIEMEQITSRVSGHTNLRRLTGRAGEDRCVISSFPVVYCRSHNWNTLITPGLTVEHSIATIINFVVWEQKVDLIDQQTPYTIPW